MAWFDMSTNMWQLFHPPSLCVIQPFLESIHYDLVNSLGLPIPLGVGWGRISIHNSQLATVPRFAIELEAVVQNEGMRDPESGDDVFPNKPLDVHISDVR